MIIDGWKCYNYAAIPSTPPHEPVNILPIENGSIWKISGGKKVKLVRWHSDWDCGYETEWWFCIKDSPFDISKLKSKRRYEIKKGNKNFDVIEVDEKEYAERFYEISKDAYETYPASYRPNINIESFVDDVKKWNDYKVYGAFSKEDGKLYGWARLLKSGHYIDFAGLKACPQMEKKGINAAIIYKIMDDHKDFLSTGGYICDGARSIQHETAFQDYLEKYFGFRKAFCKMNIIYKKPINFIVFMLYPIRKIIARFPHISIAKKLSALLKMEEINRSFR